MRGPAPRPGAAGRLGQAVPRMCRLSGRPRHGWHEGRGTRCPSDSVMMQKRPAGLGRFMEDLLSLAVAGGLRRDVEVMALVGTAHGLSHFFQTVLLLTLGLAVVRETFAV